MNEIIKDKVFGDMIYKHRWVKIVKERLKLFEKTWDINVVASAYTGEQICKEQRESYKYFQRNREQLLKKVPELLREYVKKHVPSVAEQSDSSMIQPKTILFDRNGMIVILCDAAWDEENGIGIELKPKLYIDVQDAFL